MPNYPLVSAKEVIARVIRATGYKLPSTYHDDLLEWLPEGIGMMQVTRALETKETGDCGTPEELLVKNYCASLPCGLVTLLTVQGEDGCKISEASSVRNLGLANNANSSSSMWRPASFEVNPFQHQTSDGLPTDEAGNIPPYYIDGSDLKYTANTSAKDYYKVVGNHIQTSFEEGFIKIFYLALPTDKEGYPLIPNNENFKQGLEWHIIRRLIGAGYEHKVFSYQFADEQCEKYMARGMNEVSSPSPADMERSYQTNIRLVPPIGYADQFFVNT